MRGTKHSIFASADGVELCNIDDTHYYCIFETLEELEGFIDELKEAGGLAFGSGRWVFSKDGGLEMVDPTQGLCISPTDDENRDTG